ncbi:unnamed protein product, partial [Acidithrix sp. C25]
VRFGILTLIAEAPRHGYEIIQELSARSNGVWQPSPGSVYPTLQALEDEGLITLSVVDGKKIYSLSEAGQQYLAENPRSAPPWEEMANGPETIFFDIRREGAAFASALMQVFQAGTKDQQKRALEVLIAARKAIYKILAGDDGSGE